MIALVKTAAGEGNIELREVQDPSPGPDEVKIRVHATGICGTDIKIWHGTTWSNPPVILGHEFSGTIEETGAHVEGLKPGDRVVSETAQVICGCCEYCTTGNYLMCSKRLSLGYGVNGAFAKYCIARKQIIHRVPDEVSLDEAAICEPMAVAVHAVFGSGELLPSQYAVVCGPGPIGLLTAQAARSRGAIVILCGTDADSQRLELGRELGIDHTINVQQEDPAESILKLTGGSGADYVYECSGSAQAVRMGMSVLKKRGKLVQIGLTSPRFEVEYSLLAAREISLIGSFGHKWPDWEYALRLMKNKQVNVARMITHRFALSQWADAFQVAEKQQGIKVLIQPEG
jgi:L-iditol 2-dehydrogenase